jgi:membrane fusion protein (multidrug efflux system)
MASLWGYLRPRAATAAAVLGLAGGCGQAAPPPPEPIAVEVETVEATLLRDVATFSGQLSAESSVMVKAEADGMIDEILFAEGQDVEAGQVLFRLKSEEQAAQLREAEATLALASEVYNRTHKLATAAAASQAAKDEAIANLAVAKARVEIARVALARTEVRAPFHGVTGMRLVDIGDRVDEDTPLVPLDAVDRLQVSFAITELGILFTRVGTPVEVRVAPYPGETFRGEVFFVSPTLDPATRRIVAKAWVPNPDHRLRAGLYAEIDMQVDERPNAIMVSESAIVFDRQGTFVWRVEEGDVVKRVPVETGLRRQGRVEVKVGLEPGDRIVNAGTHKIEVDGEKVVALRSGPQASGQARRATPGSGEGT